MAIIKKKRTKSTRSLVVQRLERVSKDVFRKHFSMITELIGGSPGIYALYDGNELYYVGKSTELRKRVKHHLKDRHYASWTHFSLYLVRNEDHIHEIESLLIRIANPKGNKVVPKGKSRGELLKQLQDMVKKKQNEEFEQMFGGKSARSKKIKSSGKKILEGLVDKRTMLYRAHKGYEYKAYLSPKGTIRYANKTFTSPSSAAKEIVKRAANGWHFWYIKDHNGDWVKLADYAGYV